MIKIQVLDNISSKGLTLFKPEIYQVAPVIENPDVILVRSHSLHDHIFAKNLRAVGRAGAGTDNIPIELLTRQGIPVFNSPGANANAVKELVLAAILMGYRHLDNARQFLMHTAKENNQEFKKAIEHHKKAFVGHEISGKTLGVLGLGNIGVKVANAGLGMGMKVIAYDPFISVSNALALMPEVEKFRDMNTVLTEADIISIHVPLNSDTNHFINEENISLLKPNTLLLNFSRDNIVSEEAIRHQLDKNKMLGYITDFPTIDLASHPKVLSFPHLGASTHEAEQNSAAMVVQTICNYLEQGTIEHSVNFPDIALPPVKKANYHRILIINQNRPGAIAEIAQKLSSLQFNIEQMVNTSRDSIAINLIDIYGIGDLPKTIATIFKNMKHVLHVHLIY